MVIFSVSGLPAGMDDSNLRNQLRMANNLANLQHPASGSQQVFGLGGGPGPSDP